jgi:hypothetical protein
LYLKDYRDVIINVEGRRVDPASAIASTERFELNQIIHEDAAYPVELE